MRRRPRRGLRSLGVSADVPTFTGGSAPAQSADAIRFHHAPGWLPSGRRLYVIGDIHGHSAKLAALFRLIAEDMHQRPPRSACLITLGDAINQGPDSAGVLALLADGPPVKDVTTVALLGDHERMLLDALDGDRAAATDFLWAGGRETLAGWGADPELPREHWESAVPPHHLRWLRSLVLMHQEGSYVFVHAGIRPGAALAEQSRDDLLTVRQSFPASEQDFGAIVVHGHSSTPAVHIGRNRIGLDTGAGIGGRLTCAVLEDEVIGFFAA